MEPGTPGEFAGVRFAVLNGEVWSMVLSPNEMILLDSSLSPSERRKKMTQSPAVIIVPVKTTS